VCIGHYVIAAPSQQNPDGAVGFGAAARQGEHRDSDYIVARQSPGDGTWPGRRHWQSSVVVCTGDRCMSQRLLPATAAPTIIRQVHVTWCREDVMVQAFIYCHVWTTETHCSTAYLPNFTIIGLVVFTTNERTNKLAWSQYQSPIAEVLISSNQTRVRSPDFVSALLLSDTLGCWRIRPELGCYWQFDTVMTGNDGVCLIASGQASCPAASTYYSRPTSTSRLSS